MDSVNKSNLCANTAVNKPSSMPSAMFQFMIGSTEKKSFDCFVKVNEVGLKRLEAGETLKIGSKTLNHISEDICTVGGLTRDDLKTIYSIAGPRMTMDEGHKTHHYKVTANIDWIDHFKESRRIMRLCN